MKISTTEIEGLLFAEGVIYPDARGFFSEMVKKSDLVNYVKDLDFSQINYSVSNKGVIRGLHFQKGVDAQGKFVRVLNGRVYDVIVDMRENSPSYKKWLGFELSSKAATALYVPPGCAHGFSVLEDNTIFVYACTKEYNKNSESGIRYDDESLLIDWKVSNPIVSDKDKLLPNIK